MQLAYILQSDLLYLRYVFGVGRWRTRSNVKAFPRTSMNGLPLRRTGQSGDIGLTPIPNLLMFDG